MQYPGGKNGSGNWQRLISLMPPHEMYIEAFGGSGAVIRHKRRSSRDVYIDADLAAVEVARAAATAPIAEGVEWVCGDAMELVGSAELAVTPATLVYCDPPYLGSTRYGRIYRCELYEESEHRRLLEWVKGLGCMVMLSGYESPLYAAELAGWRVERWESSTRRGTRTECCWMNFAEPVELHDPRYAGGGFRERERVKRKRQRWERRLAAMPAWERQIILEAAAAMMGAPGNSSGPLSGQLLSEGDGALSQHLLSEGRGEGVGVDLKQGGFFGEVGQEEPPRGDESSGQSRG